MAEVVCGDCEVSGEIVTNDDGDTEVVCPSCGKKDSLEDVQRSVSEHLAHQASLSLQQTVARAIKGDKFVKLETKPISKRRFRWQAKDVLQ